MDRASEKEMEAAEALLELGRETENSDVEQQTSQNTLPRVIYAKTDSETDSEHSVQTEHSKTINFNNTNKKSTENEACCSSNKENSRRLSTTSNSSVPSTSSQEDIITVFDQGTQTDDVGAWLPPRVVTKLEYMERIFKDLMKNIGILTTTLINNSNVQGGERSDPNPPRVHRTSAQSDNDTENANGADLIPIGNGNAKVPARLLHDIDWNSYTSATRRLLQAIFPRRVLATHSLTGKQSPAFQNRPPKEMLDPQLVEDIVQTVSRRCGVAKNLVRNSITIKCSDEAKLYRNRQQQNQARRPPLENEENVPPLNPHPQRTNRRPF